MHSCSISILQLLSLFASRGWAITVCQRAGPTAAPTRCLVRLVRAYFACASECYAVCLCEIPSPVGVCRSSAVVPVPLLVQGATDLVVHRHGHCRTGPAGRNSKLAFALCYEVLSLVARVLLSMWKCNWLVHSVAAASLEPACHTVTVASQIKRTPDGALRFRQRTERHILKRGSMEGPAAARVAAETINFK